MSETLHTRNMVGNLLQKLANSCRKLAGRDWQHGEPNESLELQTPNNDKLKSTSQPAPWGWGEMTQQGHPIPAGCNIYPHKAILMLCPVNSIKISNKNKARVMSKCQVNYSRLEKC
jgi:hypothetical protein